MFDIIGIILGGIIIGLLGKFVAPGNRDNIPLKLTILCGIGGLLLGSWLCWVTGIGVSDKASFDPEFLNTSPGVDWIRHTWQILTAAVLVMVAAFVTGRGRTRSR